MALTLMPDGKTFKKLNRTQENALNTYYKQIHDKPLTETLGLPLGLAVLGGIGAIAYIFKDEIKKAFDEQEKAFVDWFKGLPVAAGGGVADLLIKAGDLIFPQNPLNPEYTTLSAGTPEERTVGPFSLCQRWGLDADDWLANVQAGKFLTKIGAALAGNYIIKNMKKEGCSRPQAITQAQWDDI